MPPNFNDAQMAIIEEYWIRPYFWKDGRLDSRHTLSAAVRCNMVGPPVTSQAIGRYLSERRAAAEGRPRAVQKTPEQLALLQVCFDRDPYPTVGEQIILVHQTGLEPKKVKAWLENQRRKLGDGIYSMNPASDPNDAQRMWRAYKRDPDGYFQALYEGEISLLTGDEL